jgi:hypothetical protein
MKMPKQIRFALTLVLLTGSMAARSWQIVSLVNLAAGKVKATHIAVTGTVTLVKHEADGDLHIRLNEGAAFIVAECIPELPCVAPKLGQRVQVRGISRFDAEHGWYEVHPVESITVQ